MRPSLSRYEIRMPKSPRVDWREQVDQCTQLIISDRLAYPSVLLSYRGRGYRFVLRYSQENVL